jgi:beta-lactamase regulating signal transducer with metallopeptidase domain
MNRTILTFGGVLSASSLLLMDSAIKGTVLLALAAVAALLLRRDSAATRHLVWMMAIIALLIVPALSATLPQWRVLPNWMSAPIPSVAATDRVSPSPVPRSIGDVIEIPVGATFATPVEVDQTTAPAVQPVISVPDSQSTRMAPKEIPTPIVWNWSWMKAIPLVWAIGFVVLMLRLSAARWMLWNSERHASDIGRQVAPQIAIVSRSDSATTHDPIVIAMTALCSQLKIRRPVTLLIHPRKTIPVVWGIVRCRLMLPAAARQWSDEQLQSVLMHELAHIQRGDTLVQLLTQIACALHWFNPLVWFAAWRLDVERERSCDDLVLASGVRPSAYAAHLLDIVSGLSPARWTQACGLAMARKSSLEGRLTAVLGKDRNRRGVSLALGGLALATAIGIAVPVAMLRAQEQKQVDETTGDDENKQNPQDTSVQSGNKIDLNTEAQLDWGETVNGLRAATIIHGQPPAICLALQNVSQAPLRFTDTVQTEDLRNLILSDSKGILFVLTADEPTQIDVLLQPREVVYLRMMPPVKEGEHSAESALIEGLRKDTLQSWEIALKIDSAPEGAWKGTLVTAPTRAAVSAQSPQPKTNEGRALYKRWQDTARRNGDIPGGLLSILHDKVKEFTRNNESGGPVAKNMTPLEPRFSNKGDWKPADVVAILDDIAAVSTIPLETTIEHFAQRTVQFGQQLPATWQNADWGKPLESGLRMAYVLEPLADEYHIGTEMKSRIVLHNSGKEPVTFVTSGFQQPIHTATLVNGFELKLDSTSWLTRGRPQAYRLAPGEFCEVYTPGLGIGAQNNDLQEWSDVRAGSWILCEEGDEVIFSPGAALLSGMNELSNSADWWQEFIAQRLAHEMPVPQDTIEREYLLYRVVRELYGAAPSTTEGDAFAADTSPDALKNLAVLLAKHPYGKQSQGSIQPGKTKFRVLPPDPDAALRPRIATNPGRYKLSDEVRLIVTRSGRGKHIINEGSVIWFPPGKENISLDLKLPLGYDTWSAGWEPGTTVLWVLQKDLLQSVDIADPAAMKVSGYEGAEFFTAPIPVTLRAAMEKAIVVSDASSQIHEPQPPASLAPAEEPLKPMHKHARTHYEIWQRFARTNGDIPGALVGDLAKDVKVFIGYNPTWETVPKLNEILLRLDATHDWKPANAIALLDEVAGVQDTLLEPTPWKGSRQTIRKGEVLPKKYADATWGEEQPSGLRAAWVLESSAMESSAMEHRVGAAIKARLLVQNRRQVPVMIQAPTFHQGWVKGTDANGAEVQVSGISWTTMAMLNTVHLGPGEYIEINTPGVGIGPLAGKGPWAGPRVGANVLAKPGDELTLTYSHVPLDGSEVGVSAEDPHVSGPGWWLAHIKARLSRELPLPSDAAERTRILDRAVRELFATAPTAEETAEFIADKTPNAIDALANRLAARADVQSFSGKLPTAPAKFRVLDADANADNRPRVVLGPGEYPLASSTPSRGAATLKIVGKPAGDRQTNDAQILFEATEATGKLPPDPHKIEVPDGWGTWAIVCRPGEGFFYLQTNGAVRKIDYSNSREVTDTPVNDLPAELRDEVKRTLDILQVSAESQAEIFEKPVPPAEVPNSKTSASISISPTAVGTTQLVQLSAADYNLTGVHWEKFIEEDAKRPDGKLMGQVLEPSLQGDNPLVLGLRVDSDARWNIGGEARVELVVRNQSQEDVKFAQTLQSDVGLSVVAIDKDGKEYPAKIAPSDSGLLVFNRLLLPKNGYVTTVKSFTIRFDAEERFDSDINVVAFHLRPGDYKLCCKWNDPHPDVAHQGEWTGELVNEELKFTLTATVVAPQASDVPTTKQQEPFTAWGQEVGGLQAGFCITNANEIHIGGKVKAVVKLRNVSEETISVTPVPLWMLFGPTKVVDFQDKPVRTTGGPYPLLHIGLKKLTLKPGDVVDVDKTEIPVAELNQEVKAPNQVADRQIIHVEPGKYKVNCTGFVQEHSELSTGSAEFEVKAGTVSPEMKRTDADGKTVDTSINTDSKDEHFDALASAKPDQDAAQISTAQPDWVLAWDFRITPLEQQYSKMRISKDGRLETILRKPPLLRTQLSSEDLSELIALVAKNPRAKSQPMSKLAMYSNAISPTPELFEALKKVQVRSEIIAVIHEGELFELDLNTTEAVVVDVQLKKFVGLAAIGGSEELSKLVELANRELTRKYPNISTPIDPTDFYDGEVDLPSGKISVWFNYSIDPESTDGQMVLLRISENGQSSIEQVILPRVVSLDELEETGWKLPIADVNIVTVPEDQYVKSGFAVDELAAEGVMWNDAQNGLSLGYRITGDEWRILGKEVKVELWVQNHGDKDVTFQDSMRADPEFGLQVKLKNAKGEDHNSNFWPDERPPFGQHRLLPPGHALKVKEFTVSLFLPENEFSFAKGHFFGINPGTYNFNCELELPGFSVTGEGGKQLTPAVGEWTGKLTTRGLNIEVIAPDAPASKPRIESVVVGITKDGETSLDRKKMSLDELKTGAARNANKWFTIQADEDVPYAKVIAVLETLQSSGVTQF